MTSATDPPVSLAAYLATKQRDKPAPTHPHTPPPPTNGTIHPYAAAALRDECADLAATPEGQRNHRLNHPEIIPETGRHWA